MKLRLTPRAESDLIDIASCLVKRDPRAARRVEDARQGAFPEIGRELRGRVRRLALPRYPNLIFYGAREADAVVDVFTVRHAARLGEDESDPASGRAAYPHISLRRRAPCVGRNTTLRDHRRP